MPSRAWPLASELPVCHQGDLSKVPIWCHVQWLPTLSPERLPKLLGPLGLVLPHYTLCRWPPATTGLLLVPEHASGCPSLLRTERASLLSLPAFLIQTRYQHIHAAWLDPIKVMLPILSLPRISLYPSHSNNLSLVLVSISVSCFSLL